MQQGAVWWQKGDQVRRLRRARRELATGDQLHLYLDPRVLAMAVPPAVLIADEGCYSIWNKPAGMLSQGSKWGDHCTLTRHAEQHLTPQRSAFLVHRLDRAANGLMVIAHSKKAARALSRQFHDRQVSKRYRAQVYGQLPARAQPLQLDSPLDNKNAHSEVSHLSYDPDKDRTWVEVHISTGRKHQVRRHLAAAGWPIVGDYRYVPKALAGTLKPDEPLQLTAWQLGFSHPETGKNMRYELPPPNQPAESSVPKSAQKKRVLSSALEKS